MTDQSTSIEGVITGRLGGARANPTATYRLQFHKDFNFQQARHLVRYLRDLGISHIYASPITRATPGSTHGYDVCDHNELNPDLGSRADFDALIEALHESGMGLIADFVPNHMGIGEMRNRWWADVLENGEGSVYARFFDIDWKPLKRELKGRVLLPILGDHYGRVLERGELRLTFENGAFALNYHENQFPIAPRTTRPLLERASLYLDEPISELASIQGALNYLPGRRELTSERIVERMREKEIIRERLARLCETNPKVRQAIERVVEEINTGGDPKCFDRLDDLINAQSYRLSFWRVASEEINYRRFFDINSLAAIRVELPEVFDETHQLLLALIANGSVDGVRIDHIDGLANPREYLSTLQARAAEARKVESDRGTYLLVEKILGDGEHLRADWPVDGTTGYEFAVLAVNTLVDSRAEASLTESYERFIGTHYDPHEIVYRSKRLVMQTSLSSEVNVLGHLLNRISESNRWYRDFTLNSLTAAVREVIACFPVYRSYLVPGNPPDEHDTRVITRALAEARRRNPALERTVFSFLRDVLLPPEDNPHPVDENLRRKFVLKFQQCTGPITAKGVEDTAFYVYNRLVALNEVGGEPAIFGRSIDDFHRANQARAVEFPRSMLATSTHDTKRSEDVRARIAAISELPKEWAHAVRRWHTVNHKHLRQLDDGQAPDPNEEYLIYQTLVGSWPLEPMNAEQREEYTRRIQEYMVKALHEAKVNSSWLEPNETWDNAVKEFIAEILRPGAKNRFVSSLEPFANRIAELGAVNSLTQLVWKTTVPGVPDIYQGTEMWDFSLVDPDNRRPVDYTRRMEALASIAGVRAADLWAHWRDGRIKLFISQRILQYRREHPELFLEGSYTAVETAGIHAGSVVAYERAHHDHRILVVTSRLTSNVGFPPCGECWADTVVRPAPAQGWVDLLTGRQISGGNSLRAAEILAELPVAVLTNQTQAPALGARP